MTQHQERLLQLSRKHLNHEEYEEIVQALAEDDLLYAQKCFIGCLESMERHGRISRDLIEGYFAEIGLKKSDVELIRDHFGLE